MRVCEFCGCTTNAKIRFCCDRGNIVDTGSVPIFYQDGEELLRMRSLAKRRKERIEVLEELLKSYRWV